MNHDFEKAIRLRPLLISVFFLTGPGRNEVWENSGVKLRKFQTHHRKGGKITKLRSSGDPREDPIEWLERNHESL
ncbi:Hypothetical protein NTJ_05347 [Nesidiocoris tenuis]|uniref:Uncharacterized protein n=1 Tax=Nesidiocoris tenuis TaxID=355587 RepID=A0ABN7AKF7_9HEMI|nr:Hypothetical protein NTJ_05347 [Nesidiocoris tenuis]